MQEESTNQSQPQTYSYGPDPNLGQPGSVISPQAPAQADAPTETQPQTEVVQPVSQDQFSQPINFDNTQATSAPVDQQAPLQQPADPVPSAVDSSVAQPEGLTPTTATQPAMEYQNQTAQQPAYTQPAMAEIQTPQTSIQNMQPAEMPQTASVQTSSGSSIKAILFGVAIAVVLIVVLGGTLYMFG